MTQADTQPLRTRRWSGPLRPDGFALGLGLTNECNLACSFCYRDPARVPIGLSLEQVRSVMESLPVRSVNLGTGENGMHPEFREILAYLRTLPVKLTITSNGHSAAALSEDELRAFHDVEFSLDYPTEREQDAQRGAGNWALIHEQAERCVRQGVPVTIIAVMMKAKSLASDRCGESSQTVRRSLASECVPGRAIRPLCAVIRRILGRFPAPFCRDRCDRHRRAPGAGDGRPAANRRRMWRQHGASYSPRHNAALRLLARHRRAAVRVDFVRVRDSELCAF